MGMQSSRMIYKGKDHKDIYFQGKYHDAMYLGYELLWHKIRQEGYYVIILPNGKEEKSEKGVYVISFDEKTGEFEIIMDVKDHPDMWSENFFSVAYVVDGKRIYVSNIVEGDILYASTDGIYFEKTNIKLENQQDLLPFFATSYHSYSETINDNVEKKADYFWGLEGVDNRYWIRKSKITKSGNQYSIESKLINTGLRNTSPYPSYDAVYKMMVPSYGESRFSLHVEHYVYTYFNEKYVKTTVKYYDTEQEVSGDILKFQYKDAERSVAVLLFSFANGYYVFFVREHSSEFKVWEREKLYIYYSDNGITYSNSIIYDKTIYSEDYAKYNFPGVWLLLYRNNMYYIYGGPEENEYYGAPYTVFLTTDFKHFQKKKIPYEININGETINTSKLISSEAKITNKERRYFFNGYVSEPLDGILTIRDGKIYYIDNMFFRESKGNKILTLP